MLETDCIPRAACARHTELSLSLATRPGFLSQVSSAVSLSLTLSLSFPFVSPSLFLRSSFLSSSSLSDASFSAPRRLDRLICVARPSKSISRTALISAALMNFNRKRAQLRFVRRSGMHLAEDDYDSSGERNLKRVNWDLSHSHSLSLSLSLSFSVHRVIMWAYATGIRDIVNVAQSRDKA